MTDPVMSDASAGTREPSESMTISRGTISDAGTLLHSPSRSTSVVGARRFFSAARAAPARPSWMKPRCGVEQDQTCNHSRFDIFAERKFNVMQEMTVLDREQG